MVKRKIPNWRERDRDVFDDFFGDSWPYDRVGHRFDLFDEFEEQFKRMQQRMNNLYRKTLSGDFGVPQGEGPKVYGWTYKIGEDGKPVFQEFGNIPRSPLSKLEELPGSREPLIDVQETDKQIVVIAEIPGVSKEDIDLEITNKSLIIRVDNPERRYYKEVELPDEVDQEKGDAKFNNGVLTITLNKLRPKTKGKKLEVD
jgi:HSP20 family protein